MNEQVRNLLPAILWIGLVIILALAALILLYASPELKPLEPRSIEMERESSPTLLPTATSTVTATLRPTWTLRPSETSTSTPTFTLTPTPTRQRIATLTPARPVTVNDRYQIKPLSAETMDQIALMIADYPDAQYPDPKTHLSEEYSGSFIYPALIFQEALLRFPEAEQRTHWEWGLAYSLARSGAPQAVLIYRDLLLEALQRPGFLLAELPDWFHQQSPRLSLRIHELNVPEAQDRFALLEIPEGHVVFLLQSGVNEAPSLYPLTERFNFNLSGEIAVAVLDFDGDGFTEVALYLPEAPGNTSLAQPKIFDLSAMPPEPLPVLQSPPLDFRIEARVSMEVTAEESTGQRLNIIARIYPACPFTISQAYHWDGSRAVPLPPDYTFQPEVDILSYCAPLLALAEDFWETEARLTVEEALLPFWPPETDPQGRLYPAAAADELRFKRAINLALSGRTTEALAALQQLIQNPADPSSIWGGAAASFIQTLQATDNLYQACREAPWCDMRAALKYLIQTHPQSDPLATLNDLRQAGVEERASGIFDFDQDGEAERWFTLRHRAYESLEFWLLATTREGVRGVFVDQVETDATPYWSNAEAYPSVFQLKPRVGYRLRRIEESQLPVVEVISVKPVLSTYTRDAILQAEQSLFAGEDPVQVQNQLLALRQSGRFNCKTHHVCDRYQYALGLAAELAGNSILARDTYLQLWWENPASPLAAAARLKLLYIPPPSPTPRLTSSPTITLTPTISP